MMVTPPLLLLRALLLALLRPDGGQCHVTNDGHHHRSSPFAFSSYGSTPLLTTTINIPELNWALARAIHVIHHHIDTSGRLVSNVGGWQSHSNLFDYIDHLKGPAPRLSEALQMLSDAVHSFAAETLTALDSKNSTHEVRVPAVWANVNERGHSNSRHTHPNCFLSGVFYVDVGWGGNSTEKGGDDQPSETAGGGGRLIFHDPRDGSRSHPLAKPPVAVTPTAGLMVLFPSWLPHSVEPHEGPSSRLTVSFNVHASRILDGGNNRIPRLPYDAVTPEQYSRLFSAAPGIRVLRTDSLLASSSSSSSSSPPPGLPILGLMTPRTRRDVFGTDYGYTVCPSCELAGMVESAATGTPAESVLWDLPEAADLRLVVECAVARHACRHDEGSGGASSVDLSDISGVNVGNDCDAASCDDLRSRWKVGKRMCGGVFEEEYLPHQLPVRELPWCPRSDVSGVVFATEGFEQGLVLRDPRSAAAVIDIGLESVSGESVLVAQGGAVGGILTLPSFVSVDVTPPPPSTTSNRRRRVAFVFGAELSSGGGG